MVQTRCLLLAALAVTQIGCANHGDQYTDRSTARPGWACRQLNRAKQDTLDREKQNTARGMYGQTGDAGSVAGALIVWPILAGACAVSRS